jgi:cyclohexanone monooxygenase
MPDCRAHLACRRHGIDTDYFATFKRPNVTLVDIKTDPIQEITAKRRARRGHRP